MGAIEIGAAVFVLGNLGMSQAGARSYGHVVAEHIPEIQLLDIVEEIAESFRDRFQCVDLAVWTYAVRENFAIGADIGSEVEHNIAGMNILPAQQGIGFRLQAAQ